MTLTTYQELVHALYSGDSSTPASSTGEYSVRTTYLKAAINAWDTEKGVFWNELWTTLTDAATGDKTVTSSTTAYDMPTDFRFLGGYVVTYTTSDQKTKWKVVTPEKANVKDGDSIIGLDEGHVWVTGNTKTGFTLNFSSQPTVGDTIDYPYYKTAFEPSSGSDVIEMNDPYFAVYFALSKLHEQDGEGDRATFAMSQAEAKLISMKTLNAQLPHYQQNSVDDSTIIRTSQGFGH